MPKPMIARLQFALAIATLCMAATWGGGQGTLGDSVVQMISLGLIGISLWRHQADPMARLPVWAWLAALPLLLPLAQLLPLPEGLWRWPAARSAIASEWAAAGVEPVARWSLVPLATERALAWMLPGVALFLGGLQMAARQRGVLVALFVVLACIGALLGLAQLAGGSDSPLRFYEITNIHGAVGFFANRNHHATFMAMALPFAVVGTAWWLNERAGGDGNQVLWLAAGVGLVTVLVLGIAIANSRAGLLLGAAGFLLAVVSVVAMRRRSGTKRVVALVAAVVLTLVVQFALLGILQNFRGNTLDDARVRFTDVTAVAAKDHGPLGTGLGGFRRAFETYDRDAPRNVYVNHAHNDPAELWLEGGWLAVLLALPLAGAFLWAGWRAWRPDARQQAGVRALRQAAWIALLLVLLHSLVDYPLRTSAHLALFGLLAALLSRPSSQELKAAP